MTQLSKTAWNKAIKIVDSIHGHPFNTELALGTLPADKFAYYIEQDIIYLQDYARSLALIASRSPINYSRDFLAFADGALVAEQETVHKIYTDSLNIKKTNKLSPATISYTSFILQKSSLAPIEVAIAAILPCFWVYKEVGNAIAKSTTKNNPYAHWIDTYSGKEFNESVTRAINIFDEIAKFASENIQKQMLEAFYYSTVLEWHFWNDAYHMKHIDGFLEK